MNTKFKSIVTGAILEPNSEMVAEQLRKNPSFVVYDGQEAAQGDEKPLSKMNKDELLKVAQDAEIAVPDGATKAEICGGRVSGIVAKTGCSDAARPHPFG